MRRRISIFICLLGVFIGIVCVALIMGSNLHLKPSEPIVPEDTSLSITGKDIVESLKSTEPIAPEDTVEKDKGEDEMSSSESLESILEKLEKERHALERQKEEGQIEEVLYKTLMKYIAFKEAMAKSNYMIVKGELVRVSTQLPLSPQEEDEMKIINIALDAIKGSVSLQERAKVLIQLEKDHYIVTFEHRLPEGARGPEYAARVIIDAESYKILKILGGS